MFTKKTHLKKNKKKTCTCEFVRVGREDEGGEKGRGGTPQNESIFAVIQKVNMRLMFGGGERERKQKAPSCPAVRHTIECASPPSSL